MKTNDFFPKDYKDDVSRYMKLSVGANRFRILSHAVGGWEYWVEDKDGNRKPVRKHFDEELVLSEIPEPDKIKKFLAFVVWNYNDEAIEILEITQKSIKKALKALIDNKKWGSPINKYDIVITREGEGLKTKYTVQPEPIEPTDEKILKEYKKVSINLEALFTGDDPFLMPRGNEDIDPESIKI